MNNKRINILAEGEWILPKATNVKKYNKKLGFLSEWKCARSLEVNTCISSDVYEVDFSEVPPLYPHKGMHVPDEGIAFADGDGRVVDVGNNGITYIVSTGKTFFINFTNFTKKEILEQKYFELKRTLPKTINVCGYCFKEVCECAPQLSAETWTDKLKIMNWCHKQKEVVLVDLVHEGSYVLWIHYCFDEDRLHKYKWNKINPETNELMYSESKVFCDKECL